jgi:hypothetical protein
MCYHHYTSFTATICKQKGCLQMHTHQCSLCKDYLKVVFCEYYETKRTEAKGYCPEHEDRALNAAVQAGAKAGESFKGHTVPVVSEQFGGLS